MTKITVRGTVAWMLAIALPFALTPAWGSPGAGAALAGKILMAEGKTPVPDAVVKVAMPDGTVKTAEVNKDGVFRLENLPAGKVDVVIETPEGAYKLDGDLTLEEGKTRTVQMALKKSARPIQEPPLTAPAQAGSGSKYGPVIGIISVIAFGLLVDELSDEDKKEGPASQFNPGSF